MDLLSTEAVILKSTDWSDSSKILTLFSAKFGKIKVVARGAKRAKSKFLGCSEVLQSVDVVVQHKETRELDILHESSLLRHYRLSDRFEHYYCALALAEFTTIVTEISDPHPEIYETLTNILNAYESIRHPESYLLFYLIWMTQVLGYELSFTHCGSCGNPLEKTYQYHQDYGVLCKKCEFESIPQRMLPKMYQCLSTIMLLPFDQIDRVSVNPILFKETVSLVLHYIETHQNERIHLKSLDIFFT